MKKTGTYDAFEIIASFLKITLFLFHTVLRSKKCLESLNKFRKKSKRPGNRLFYQYCPGTNYVTSTTQTNLTYFPKPCHLKLCIIKSNFALVENIAKWTGMAASNALVIGKKIFDKMFVIGKSAKPRCFKDVQNLPCLYRAPKRHILKNGYVNLIPSSKDKDRKISW